MPTLSELQTNIKTVAMFRSVTLFQCCQDLSILVMIIHSAGYNFQSNNMRRSKVTLLGHRYHLK